MAKVGYARVSVKHQDLSNQIDKLIKSGCTEIFSGKQSGVKEENDKKLAEMLSYIRKGDVVITTRLDRFGRSLKSILKVIDDLHAKGAKLQTLDGAIDTSNNSPLATATISLLGAFAQLERDLIVDRTSEGRERAIKNGKKFGRKPKLTDTKKEAVIKEWNYGNGLSISKLGVKYAVSRMTISRIVKAKC